LIEGNSAIRDTIYAVIVAPETGIEIDREGSIARIPPHTVGSVTTAVNRAWLGAAISETTAIRRPNSRAALRSALELDGTIAGYQTYQPIDWHTQQS
jgi:hypothetical protein